MQSNQAAKMGSSRKTLIAVILLFVVPSMVAALLYTSGWRPSSTVNNGELIVPARPIADRALQSVDGKQVQFSELLGKWTMVYFDQASCPEECVSQLFFMRQIHSSQGKDYGRLQRLFILNNTDGIDSLKPKLADYPDMLVWTGDKVALAKLREEFGVDSQTGAGLRNIFLIDPQGNLMMRYKPGIQPAGMRKDIERLLKYSNEK